MGDNYRYIICNKPIYEEIKMKQNKKYAIYIVIVLICMWSFVIYTMYTTNVANTERQHASPHTTIQKNITEKIRAEMKFPNTAKNSTGTYKLMDKNGTYKRIK